MRIRYTGARIGYEAVVVPGYGNVAKGEEIEVDDDLAVTMLVEHQMANGKAIADFEAVETEAPVAETSADPEEEEPAPARVRSRKGGLASTDSGAAATIRAEPDSGGTGAVDTGEALAEPGDMTPAPPEEASNG